MNMESRGIFLKIWSKPEYGMMASQLAMSIKKHSPLIPIHLQTDHVAVSRLRNLNFFDTVEYTDTPTDPAQAKIDMYDSLPFDHTIFLDADGLCVSEMDSVFDSLIADDKPFRCFVYAQYTKDHPPIMPLMVWANRDTIWEHYNFTDEVLPASQSSLLYIRKGEFCDNLYRKMKENYVNKIPLDKLRYKWGGGQPDELYLNVTLAQLNYDPSCKNLIYFADDRTYQPHQIKHQYKILSLFGTAGNVKPLFERFYDKEVEAISRELNSGVVYKWRNIKHSKHANTQQVAIKRSAFRGQFIRSEKLNPASPIVKRGKTMLFTSYYDAKHPGRQRELLRVLQNNLDNKEIDSITLLTDTVLDLQHEKMTVIPFKRPTYQDFIDLANKTATENDVVVIANSDIYFDQTINWPHALPMQNTMLALSRWDVHASGNKRLFAYEHSQDSWFFKGKIKVTGCDYHLGLRGCDNRFAFDVEKSGYRVRNTAKDIITYHLHNVDIRTHNEHNRLHGDYLPVFISSVRDIKANKVLIQQPGKVGDIIKCLPIAKHYFNKGYAVEWECPKQYHSLFRYTPYVTAIETRSGEYSKIIDISFGLNLKSPTNITWSKRKRELDSFVSLKYELSGVPVSDCFKLEYERNIPNENNLFTHLRSGSSNPYILIHSSSHYGTPIDVDSHYDKIFFSPVDGYTIFDWRKVIETAKEIHCIDSSLCNFVDSIKPDNPKLFYYITDRVPMQADRTLLQMQWETINQLEYANS